MALTDKQRAAHANALGGSQVATALGLNPYQSPEELRLEILGRLPPFEGNEATEAGEIMEEGIRQLYARRTGRTVRRSHVTLTHPDYPWLVGHIDGKVEGEARGLECKNVHWRMARYWGEPGTDAIAEYYLPQPHVYLLLSGYDLWDVAAYFGGPDLRIFEVRPDKELAQLIAESTHDFWCTNVLKDVPCEVDVARPDALRILKRLYAGTDGTTVHADADLAAWHTVYQEASRMATDYGKTADLAKAHMLRSMQNAAFLALPDGTSYTRKIVNRKAYAVEATSYTDFRYKSKSTKGDEQ